MNILITGIHGFVGSNLTNALQAQHQLYGLDIIAPEKAGVVQTYAWDELENLPPVDAMIHLAGKAHDTKNRSEAQTYFDINTGLTEKIFDYFLQSAAQSFVFFSSVKAAADTVPGAVLTEDVLPAPVGPYGESKIKAEEYILKKLRELDQKQANSSKQLPAKKVYIVRPAMIHGPGNKGNLNLLYSVVRKGLPWPLGAFENKRSFTSIDNLTYLVEQLLTQDVPSGIYNICDDEVLSTNELIALICESLGKKVRIWHLSQSLMKGAAGVCGALHLPLNPERLRKLTENYIVSNAKIKQALGIEHLPVSAREGFRKTLLSFQE